MRRSMPHLEAEQPQSGPGATLRAHDGAETTEGDARVAFFPSVSPVQGSHCPFRTRGVSSGSQSGQ